MRENATYETYVNGRIILKWIFEEGVNLWSDFNCFNTGCTARLL
jgi:hypothetical protein